MKRKILLKKKTLKRKVPLKKIVKKAKRKPSDYTFQEDRVLAYRYSYYCLSKSLISDYQYDKEEKLAVKCLPKDSLINKPGSDKKDDYPVHIRALAVYLGLKFGFVA